MIFAALFCLTLVFIVLMICITVLEGLAYHEDARKEIMLQMIQGTSPAPILQLIPIPGSDESEPDRPDVWREEFHRKGRGAALNGNEESSLSLPVLSPPRSLR